MSKIGKINVNRLIRMKQEAKKIVATTAYDFPFARFAESAGIDLILVGDSGGMVVLGYDSTVPVTMDEMVLMSKAVSRGAKIPMLVGDMPFMSYQASREDAIRNAGRFLKEGGMDAVKIEGGKDSVDKVRAISRAGIPVIGHIGLQPQMDKFWQGYRVQGKDYRSASTLIEDASELESAGAVAIVLEMITSEVSEIITERLSIPTIGIGSGPHCDGQILVLHDIIGLYDDLTPKFVKRYTNLAPEIISALSRFREDILSGKYPEERHASRMESSEFSKMRRFHRKEDEAKIDTGRES